MKPAFSKSFIIVHLVFLKNVQFQERLPKLSFSYTSAIFFLIWMQGQSHMKMYVSSLGQQNKVFTKEEGLTPTGLVWNTNVAAFLFFWDTNIAAVTSCENALLWAES